ncbi:hypothetical protein C1645_821385 [Glomus cerebriforme]|uniref:Uncharacterized protein n=1 Tax=Glomus cerebriforme TaxID=658196 RepID=A0A397T291_9GLOM|nr:hypothetical protein C1645_821385 [Glomus cerebriforme]
MKTVTDANEATCYEFISAILHASIAIAKNLTSQDIFIVLQKDVSSEDATDQSIGFEMTRERRLKDDAFGNDYFDYIYGIVTTGIEWHSDGIYFTSSSEHQINLTKSAIKKNPELLQSNIKRIIGIIVELLKDRVSVDTVVLHLARGL